MSQQHVLHRNSAFEPLFLQQLTDVHYVTITNCSVSDTWRPATPDVSNHMCLCSSGNDSDQKQTLSSRCAAGGSGWVDLRWNLILCWCFEESEPERTYESGAKLSVNPQSKPPKPPKIWGSETRTATSQLARCVCCKAPGSSAKFPGTISLFSLWFFPCAETTQTIFCRTFNTTH